MRFAFLLFLVACHSQPASLRVSVRYRPDLSREPLDGRLLVLLAADTTREPRLQVRGDNATAQVFGLDVDGWAPGQEIALAGDVAGAPVGSLAALPPGEYFVQALLHRYETFRRGDGHTVKLPPDRGEGQQWSLAPGNLVSTPQKLRIDASQKITLELDHALPPLEEKPDTNYLRHVKFKSEKLSRFWGRDVYMGALVLLPEGWDSHRSGPERASRG